MIDLKIGKLNTKKLLEYFGTQTQQDNYIKDKKLNSTAKDRILTKARKFCNIEDLGKGKFLIHKLLGIDKDDAILPLKKGLYNYLAPLILTKLLEEDDAFKITLPFLGWARKFDMINDNYSLLKYNQEQGSEALNIDSDTMMEYFDKIDDCIKYYLQECLSILSDQQGLDLIDFDSIKMVKKMYITPADNEVGGIDVVCEYVDEVVSDDDRKYIYECETIAKEKSGITNNKEKFYGVKSYIYKRELKTLLSKRNILFMYPAYNIYCKNPTAIEKILEKFADVDVSNKHEFVSVFNEKFVEYIERKAKGRYNREIKKRDDEEINSKYLKQNRLIEQYLEDYKGLLDKTMYKDYPKLSIIDENNVNSILTEFNINIIKK